VHHDSRFEVPAYQPEQPAIFNASCQPFHQNVMVDPIEKLLQINVHNPSFPGLDELTRLVNRLMSASPRSETVAVFGELRIESWLQNL
jgi:hypothetical protein